MLKLSLLRLSAIANVAFFLVLLAVLAPRQAHAVLLNFSFSGTAGTGSQLSIDGAAPVDVSGASFTITGMTLDDIDFFPGGTVSQFNAIWSFDFGILGVFTPDPGTAFYQQLVGGSFTEIAVVRIGLDFNPFNLALNFPLNPVPCADADFGCVLGSPTIDGLGLVGSVITNVSGDFLDLRFHSALVTSMSVTEKVATVALDIKPGSDPNCFNINGHGVIPVAILGSATFDVTVIDLTTLSFAGLEIRMKGNNSPLCGVDDTNDDGILDLVCHFEDEPSSWLPDDGEATLTGMMFDGTVFQGTDSICIVP
jgi:hypothetical protein